MNRSLAFGLLILLAASAFGQKNRYVVFFADKVGADYPYSINQPESFLTARAIDRRQKQGISVDESDLPVNPEYVDNLTASGVDLYFSSRWMNAAIIQVEPSLLASIAQFDFVDSIALIAEGERLSRQKIPFNIPTTFEEPPSISATTDMQLAMLQVDLMHEKGIRGEGMLIAVLDNGFRGVDKSVVFSHLWEDGRIVAQKDFVENSGNVFRLGEHGTSVFSTIAGKYGADFSGTAYEADFIVCITEEGGSEDRIEEFNWLLGAEFADSLGADIINASLGYRMFDIDEHNYSYEDLDGQTTIVSQAAKLAAEKGMIVVVSAGNHGDNPPTKWRYITPPADVDEALVVGSVNPDFTWTPFSSLGPTSDGRIKPDVAALGLGTTIVRGSGAISRGNGTSFSSPQMAGFAAGIWQSNPDWTSQQVIEAIKAAGHHASQADTLIGNGVPFFTYAVEGKVLMISDILQEKVHVYPNPFSGDKLFLKIEERLRGPLECRVLDSNGKLVFEKTIRRVKLEKVYELLLDNVQDGLYYLSLQNNQQTKVVKLIKF